MCSKKIHDYVEEDPCLSFPITESDLDHKALGLLARDDRNEQKSHHVSPREASFIYKKRGR
jgi:hypothetical protein